LAIAFPAAKALVAHPVNSNQFSFNYFPNHVAAVRQYGVAT